MQMSRSDEEQDCDPVAGSNSMHEFWYSIGEGVYVRNTNFAASFAGKEGELSVRRLPCLCPSCRKEQFNNCEKLGKVGPFEERVMEKKGMRRPEMRYEEYSRKVRHGKDTFTVANIVGNRYLEGVYQYKVEWEGFDDSTWVDADHLTCIDLIEAYEQHPIPE